MDAKIALNVTRSFIKERPRIVAGLLEQHNPETVAVLFKLLDDDVRLELLTLVLPTYLARVGEYWEDDYFAEILSELEMFQQTAILRCVETVRREEIIQKLPAVQRVNLKAVLGYANHLVGSWMNPKALFIPSDDHVAQALARIKNTEGEFLHDPLFVVDREHTVLGKISVYTLLKSPKDTPISALMNEHVATLSARISLDTADSHPAWHTEDILPVVNQDEKVVGVLEYISLIEGLEMLTYESDEGAETEVVNHVLESYCEVLENVSKSLLSLRLKTT